MRALTAVAVAGVCAIAIPVMAQNTAPSPTAPATTLDNPTVRNAPAVKTPSAATFAHKAATSDDFEIESSRLAKAHSKNKSVQDFAAMMIEDHTKSTNKLFDALHAESQQEPALPAKLDGDQAAMLKQLEPLNGPQFDRAYMDDQVKGHLAAQALLQQYSQNGEDHALRSFAAEVLPTVEMHLQRAQQIVASFPQAQK